MTISSAEASLDLKLRDITVSEAKGPGVCIRKGRGEGDLGICAGVGRGVGVLGSVHAWASCAGGAVFESAADFGVTGRNCVSAFYRRLSPAYRTEL